MESLYTSRETSLYNVSTVPYHDLNAARCILCFSFILLNRRFMAEILPIWRKTLSNLYWNNTL